MTKALTKLLPFKAAQNANRAAQQEEKKCAFFQESLRPDSQANAADFVSDLSAVLIGPPPAPDPSLPRREAAKTKMQHRMAARSVAEVGEAARFEHKTTPSGLPGWLYRWTLASTKVAQNSSHLGRVSPRPSAQRRSEDPSLAMLYAITGHLRERFDAALFGLRSVRSSFVAAMTKRRLQTKHGGYRIRQGKLQIDNPRPEKAAAGKKVVEHEPDLSEKPRVL